MRYFLLVSLSKVGIPEDYSLMFIIKVRYLLHAVFLTPHTQ